jgi:hypothetical protein
LVGRMFPDGGIAIARPAKAYTKERAVGKLAEKNWR